MKPGTLKIHPIKGQLKENPKRLGRMSPFIVFTLGGQRYRTQPSIEMDTQPVWNEEFYFNVVVPGEIKIEVFDLENDQENLIGRMEISTDDVCLNTPLEKVFHLKSKHIGVIIGQVQIKFEWQPGGALLLPIPQVIHPHIAQPQNVVPEFTKSGLIPPSNTIPVNIPNVPMMNQSYEKGLPVTTHSQLVSADPTNALNSSSRSGQEQKTGYDMPIDPVRVPPLEEKLKAMQEAEEVKAELINKHHRPWKKLFHRHKE